MKIWNGKNIGIYISKHDWKKNFKNSLLENICQREKKYILNNLCSIRIYKECKWYMDNLKNINKEKQNSKSIILQHK